MLYRIYRRIMRKIARFILGFDTCPNDCRKNYKASFNEVADIFISCFAFITLFMALAVLFS